MSGSNGKINVIKTSLYMIVVGAILLELASVFSGAEGLSNFFFTIGLTVLIGGIIVLIAYIAIKLLANRAKDTSPTPSDNDIPSQSSMEDMGSGGRPD